MFLDALGVGGDVAVVELDLARLGEVDGGGRLAVGGAVGVEIVLARAVEADLVLRVGWRSPATPSDRASATSARGRKGERATHFALASIVLCGSVRAKFVITDFRSP